AASASPPPQLPPLSLHDALPISSPGRSHRRALAPSPPCSRACSPRRSSSLGSHRLRPPRPGSPCRGQRRSTSVAPRRSRSATPRSEEHTSELQSRENLVCRLLLE